MFKLADKDYKAKYIQNLKEKMIIMMEQMRKQAEKWKLFKRIKKLRHISEINKNNQRDLTENVNKFEYRLMEIIKEQK